MSWLLILTMYSGHGMSVTTVHLGDAISCKRAGLAFVKQVEDNSVAKFSCVEVRQ